MPELHWLNRQAHLTLERLLPRLDPVIADAPDADRYRARLRKHFPRAFRLLYDLYHDQYDFFYHLEEILLATAHAFMERPAGLRALDVERESNQMWFQSENMMGGVCYVDLFAGDLKGLHERLDYFEELGLTYLHLMPLFKVPADNNDGGYAISDFRQIDPRLGTMDDLREIAADLRQRGISLVLDFVFNHTSDEHTWARQALAGDETYQDFYYTFPDRTLPDEYEKNLREIFPEQSPGSFTYRPEISQWVWTTFHSFQWDLNYSNPAVFRAMLEEMLFLANVGVEIMRLDAVAFIWKELGTDCENLPQAHAIIQAFNALTKIAAPGMVYKSEAIVHPDNVASYISWEECPISYNPNMMALTWESLATREVKLLRHSMSKRFDIPKDCAWVNYVRVHDDIGWGFADEDAAEVGIHSGFDHRIFLNNYYTGDFFGSFAMGIPFNYNPRTKDMRISGTTASLAGLERALDLEDKRKIDLAVGRILMIHSLILSAGGIPLLYIGDEIATLNDYSYEFDPVKAEDSRWSHRPPFDWQRAELRHDESTVVGRVFQGLMKLVNLRKNTPAFANDRTTFIDTGSSPHVLGYVRSGEILVLLNFSEHEVEVSTREIEPYWRLPQTATDLTDDSTLEITDTIPMSPYQYRWLRRD